MAEPPDAAARARIAADLRASLLVEAGAGSGKTAAMVGRMVALVRTGTAAVDRIAAVTFTRKAAGELRERFRHALERALAESSADGPERPRLARALADPDGAFVGTVHAFCARLLRERPLEAGLPPDFREVEEGDEAPPFAAGWSRFLDHLAARPSRLPSALARVGLRPEQLGGLARDVAARPDVRFSAPPAPRPDPARVAAVRAELGALLDASLARLPAEPPARGPDPLQAKLAALRFSRRVPGWDGEPAFFDALAAALGPADVTLNRWGPDADPRELAARWAAFGAEGSAARALLDGWLAHRYGPALRLARAAAAFCARERRRAGVATFDDLLSLAAALLRRSEAARRELGARWTHLLVDEFQDTDPLQAEVLFLLAAADPAEGDWRRAAPRPGALFVVGDPKQSIYRFRRADLAVYQAVKARFRDFGAVLRLTASFRASPAVAAFVNRAFAGRFPAADQARQPAFAPLVPAAAEREGRVGWYRIEPEPGRGRVAGRRVAVPDAAALASWIAARIASGERAPGDVLVIARTRHHLAEYARALEERGVPVHLAGAAATGGEARELALLLRALDDPGDAVRAVAVLEGPFFGLSHDDLHAHAAAGDGFRFTACDPAPGPVSSALGKLRELASIAAALPADAAVDAIVDRLGLLPFAATAEAGASRADALLRALDALRGPLPSSLAEAAGRLERAADAEPDGPARPDAVRVMNLHRAKGLEAPLVVLACPAPAAAGPPPECAVEHGADGVARGFLLVRDGSRRAGAVLARPARWAEHAAAEAAWAEAEELRLLYVAATRARDELVVARCARTAETSAWRAFHAALDDPALAAELPVRAAPPSPAPPPEHEAASILSRAAALADRRRDMARPRVGVESFTSNDDDAGDGRPSGRRDAQPAADPLLHAAVRTRAEAAERRLIGVPFALRLTPAEARELGLAAEAGGGGDGAEVRIEGAIPLAFREAGAWTVVAFETGSAEEQGMPMDRARCLLRLAAACLSRVTGEPVVERLLVSAEGRELAS